jgi:hypothetical protein
MKAFPIKDVDHGMDLRDYFAAAALSGGLEQGIEDDMCIKWWHSPNKIAERAYNIADAMMKARKL